MFRMNFNGIGQRLSNIFQSNALKNVFNEAFYRFVGMGYTDYDNNLKTYIDKGYNINATVYSIIQQMSTKAASVPLFIQSVPNRAARRKLMRDKKIEQKLSLIQRIQRKSFEVIEEDPSYLPPPLERPNPLLLLIFCNQKSTSSFILNLTSYKILSDASMQTQ